MKRVTAAIALALSAAAFEPATAQAPNLQFQTPLNYRFSVMPKSHVFSYNRRPHHHWHHRHHARFYPAMRGPAVIYQNGEIGIPPEQAVTPPAVSVVATPVVYRIGETGGCGRQQLTVPGSKGRTTINVWRC
jgi:hypothetical protein